MDDSSRCGESLSSGLLCGAYGLLVAITRKEQQPGRESPMDPVAFSEGAGGARRCGLTYTVHPPLSPLCQAQELVPLISAIPEAELLGGMVRAPGQPG